jgi:hypothetical protein
MGNLILRMWMLAIRTVIDKKYALTYAFSKGVLS